VHVPAMHQNKNYVELACMCLDASV
jgi:hypothetical protein